MRTLAMTTIGVVAGLAAGLLGFWGYAPIIGWAAACLLYLAWVWLGVGRMDARQTALHVTREDPARGTSDTLIVLASVASLGALGVLLVQAGSAPGYTRAVIAGIAVGSVALSWLLVHTLFALRYAREYYASPAGGIDFNQEEPPRYLDFAYFAFTLGMTFQVSDTNIRSGRIRAIVLRHSLLSYLFGSVILAATVNLIAGLMA